MLSQENLFRLLFVLCIAGVFAGAYYYFDQLTSTAASLIIFVPDCPFYVLLALPILAKRIKSSAYSFFVAVGMAKYGLWTVFVLLFHFGAYSSLEALPITIIFILGHIGMLLLGAAILPKNRIPAVFMLLILAWFLLNDYADYFLGTRPPIPSSGIDLVRNLTVAASFAFTLGFYFYGEKVRSFPPVKFFRKIIEN